MTRLHRLDRLAFGAAAVVALALAACSRDPISGPAEQVGPPLLDMDLGPSANALLPSSSTLRISTNTARDTIKLVLANLPPVPTGFRYQVYLVDSANSKNFTGTSIIAAKGTLVQNTTRTRPVNRDSTAIIRRRDVYTNTSVIDSGGAERLDSLTITNTSLGASISSFSHVVVALVAETDTVPAATLDPATVKGFLYLRYRNAGVTPNTFVNTTADTVPRNLTLGSFSVFGANRIAFSTQGTASSSFYGRQLRARFTNLVRPPVGFRYVGWLIDDATGRQVRLGGLTTPFPEQRSLDDADVNVGSFQTTVGIVQAELRATVDTAFNYGRFALVLEPKGYAFPFAPATETFAGLVPLSVSVHRPSAGKLFGHVTRAGGQAATNTTLFLTGGSRTDALQVAVSDSVGDFKFRNVPTGTYYLKAIPFGGTTVADSELVTIRPKRTRDGLAGDSIFVNVQVP